MNEAQSVPVVPDASLYPHVSIFAFSFWVKFVLLFNGALQAAEMN